MPKTKANVFGNKGEPNKLDNYPLNAIHVPSCTPPELPLLNPAISSIAGDKKLLHSRQKEFMQFCPILKLSGISPKKDLEFPPKSLAIPKHNHNFLDSFILICYSPFQEIHHDTSPLP